MVRLIWSEHVLSPAEHEIRRARGERRFVVVSGFGSEVKGVFMTSLEAFRLIAKAQREGHVFRFRTAYEPDDHKPESSLVDAALEARESAGTS
jgi:hypothetical protein